MPARPSVTILVPLCVLSSLAGCDPAPAAELDAATVDAAIARDAASDAGAVLDAGIQGDAGIPGDAGPGDPSAGCGAGGGTLPGTSEGTLEVGGRTRTFRVHVPPSYRDDAPAPVVIMLHGGGGSGEQLQTTSSRMDPIADREGFVTVYPDGTGVLRTWNAGLCCGRAVEDGVDDVAFVAALLDHLEAELCVDRSRVFAMGMSNGAMMSHRLGCELSERIAAIAPIAGTNGAPACEPARAIPVLEIHGTDDGHVPWDGGEGCGPAGVAFPSVPETIEGWRVRNGCDATTHDSFEMGDGHCTAYDGCDAAVELCAIEGGGHSWPGGVPREPVVECPADGAQSTTFDASEAAWSFFRAHPLPR